MDKQILRKWLKAGCMENGSFNTTDAGTPQGGIISPVLANICLDGLDRALTGLFGRPKLAKPVKIKCIMYGMPMISSVQVKQNARAT